MGWPDLNSLNTFAAYVGDWKTILAGIVVILTSVGTLLKYGLAPFRWIWVKVKSARTPKDAVPKNALRFVQTEQESFWGPAGFGKEIGTQVRGHWHVTNLTKDWNFVLLKVKIRGHDHRHAHVFTSGYRDRTYSAFTPIVAGKMAQVHADFMFCPQIATGTEMLLADVIFTDNYGREYRVPSTFRFINA